MIINVTVKVHSYNVIISACADSSQKLQDMAMYEISCLNLIGFLNFELFRVIIEF